MVWKNYGSKISHESKKKIYSPPSEEAFASVAWKFIVE